MTDKLLIHDHITPIKGILTAPGQDKKELLHRLIYRCRKINNRHLYKHSVNQTVKKLLEPQWLTKVSRFDPDEWKTISESLWKRASKTLGRVSPPELVLFPGFNRFNGRVYKLDNRPIIGCSPDFPLSTGKNLEVLLAHEYAHFIRWRKTGIPSENVPIYALIYEEGWAVWFSMKLLSGFKLSHIFMSNLHASINMPDPKGGYLAWCRANLKAIAGKAQKVLKCKDRKNLGRFFQCQRLEGDDTPIRAGYYLGYRLLEMLSKRMTIRQLLQTKPTSGTISAWLNELAKPSK